MEGDFPKNSCWRREKKETNRIRVGTSPGTSKYESSISIQCIDTESEAFQ